MWGQERMIQVTMGVMVVMVEPLYRLSNWDAAHHDVGVGLME